MSTSRLPNKPSQPLPKALRCNGLQSLPEEHEICQLKNALKMPIISCDDISHSQAIVRGASNLFV